MDEDIDTLPKVIACWIFSQNEKEPTFLCDHTVYDPLNEAYKKVYIDKNINSVSFEMNEQQLIDITRTIVIPGNPEEFQLKCTTGTQVDTLIFLYGLPSGDECIESKDSNPSPSVLPLLDASLLVFLSIECVWEQQMRAGEILQRNENCTQLRGQSKLLSRSPSRTTRRSSVVEASSGEEIFRIWDLNGRGFITTNAFVNGCQQIGLNFNENELIEVFKEVTSQLESPQKLKNRQDQSRSPHKSRNQQSSYASEASNGSNYTSQSSSFEQNILDETSSRISLPKQQLQTNIITRTQFYNFLNAVSKKKKN